MPIIYKPERKRRFKCPVCRSWTVGKKTKEFCSDACRVKAWRIARKEVK